MSAPSEYAPQPLKQNTGTRPITRIANPVLNPDLLKTCQNIQTRIGRKTIFMATARPISKAAKLTIWPGPPPNPPLLAITTAPPLRSTQASHIKYPPSAGSKKRDTDRPSPAMK
ncbi:MAG TPA: hypothetical protein DIV79_02320 [Opitutae bacterium]|nr:hypothetical protein [Opitutaceae bacterium]HCR28838.1 hypothetical protein [Opitutae bacterium]